MRHTAVIFIILILMLSALQGFLVAEPISGKVTTFDDNSMGKTIIFQQDGQNNKTVNIIIPYRAVVTNSSFNVHTVYNTSGNYSYKPQIDVGSDRDFEWEFDGVGYGCFGKQNVFNDGQPTQDITFDVNNSFNNQIRFIMPNNATVSSAYMNVSGSGYEIIEDFEKGGNTTWSWSPWVSGGLGGGTVGTTYAHDGSYGIRDPGWYYRTDVTLGKKGERLSWWTRPGSATGGRSYLGFGATSSSCWSLVCAPNSGNIIIQRNLNYNFQNLVSKTFSWTANKWYRAEIAFNNNNGWVTGKIYDSNGRTLLASLSTNLTSFSAGGVAIRSFSTFYLDTIEGGMGFGGTLENFTIDIGDNGGTPEFNHTGKFNISKRLPNFATELNAIISSTNATFTDGYGIQFVEIGINITNIEIGNLLFSNLDIRYNLTCKVFLNPHNFNLINELNEVIPDTGEGNFRLPINIRSASAGGINITDISIDYFIPELTNDRLLVDGRDHGTICYADYKNYVFQVNVTNRAGTADVENVTLTIDNLGEPVKLRWCQNNFTFLKILGPDDLIIFDIPNCTNTALDAERWSLNFSVRFKWTYLSEAFKSCVVNTTNDTGGSVENEFEYVYRVENDLDFFGNLKVTAQYQGVLTDGGWVRANEKITWSDLIVVYEGTTNIYPDDKNFDITITDDETGIWVNRSSSGKKFKITTISDSYTDHDNLHRIAITNIPVLGEDVSNWTFMIRTDNDKPTVPPNVLCHADSPADPQTIIDDDINIYVTWDASNDGTGSGVGSYGMEFNNNIPTAVKKSGDTANGVEGTSTFYVRARDKVGNWGLVGSDAIDIDLTDLTFSSPTPDPEMWHNTSNVECGILISDLGGSGVRSDSIYYRFVEKGSILTGTWKRYSGATADSEQILCKETITFKSDGVNKKIQWRANDVAGNDATDPNYYTVKIDSIPIIFDGFSMDFNDWHHTRTPEITFYANDSIPENDECSGVDINSLMYQVSTSGVDNYGDWLPFSSTTTGSSASVKCTVKPEFEEGNTNYIKFKGKDNVANEFITKDYRVKVDTEQPIFSNPTPDATTWCNSTKVQCNITIKELSSHLDIESIRYSFSTNGTKNYGKWNKVSIKHLTRPWYQSVIITTNITLKEGENNYIRWLAYDTAGNSIISDNYQIRVDVTSCTFHDADPAPEAWVNTESLLCSIIINDTSGSGIDTNTIQYATSNHGPDNLGRWTSTGILKIDLSDSDAAGDSELYGPHSIRAQVPIKVFKEGSQNYISWRATDLAGTEQSYGGPYRVQIDVSPLHFMNPKPDPNSTQMDLEQSCKITIKDNQGGSGVEPNSVEYRYSTRGKSGYGEWLSFGVSQVKLTDGYKLLVYVNFGPGHANYIQWRAKDVAGNGPYQSPDYNVIINSAPRPIISSPQHFEDQSYDYTTIDNIVFNARKTTDPDSDDVLSFYWESNISGPIGYSHYFESELPSGNHQISLYVYDGNYHNISVHVNITVIRYLLIKDLDGDGVPDHIDPDIDNDGYLNDDDAFPYNKTEWRDTDLDGVGDNEDLDDDDDGHPDDEDKYPLNSERWKKEVQDSSLLYTLIAIIIIILIIILAVFGAMRVLKKKKEAEAAQAAEILEPSAAATPIAFQPLPTPVTVTPPSAQLPATFSYQQTMPIPTLSPYQPYQPQPGVVAAAPIQTLVPPAQIIPVTQFPALPPPNFQPVTTQPIPISTQVQPPVQQQVIQPQMPQSTIPQPAPLPPQPQPIQPQPLPQPQPLIMPPPTVTVPGTTPQQPAQQPLQQIQSPQPMPVFKCENCGAPTLDESHCPFCGWQRIY